MLAIAGTVISSFAMLVFALLVVLKAVWSAFRRAEFDLEHAKHLAVELIEMTDFFLLGMVLYVVAVGMFQLFIDDDIPVPSWMQVDGLADLKTQLIDVIVVVLAVSFLAEAVAWTSGRSILYFGISVAVVIMAMAGYNLIHHWMSHNHDAGHPE